MGTIIRTYVRRVFGRIRHGQIRKLRVRKATATFQQVLTFTEIYFAVVAMNPSIASQIISLQLAQEWGEAADALRECDRKSADICREVARTWAGTNGALDRQSVLNIWALITRARASLL